LAAATARSTTPTRCSVTETSPFLNFPAKAAIH
jgi:hypothetical protein